MAEFTMDAVSNTCVNARPVTPRHTPGIEQMLTQQLKGQAYGKSWSVGVLTSRGSTASALPTWPRSHESREGD
jgi:hypothetical protein